SSRFESLFAGEKESR
nr:Chain B, FxxLF motif peptide [synthetic construct]